MPDDGAATLTMRLHAAIKEIDPADWDACAGDINPFVSHAFLSVVEDSGSATSRTGWLPQHAVLRDESGTVVAVAPMYAKSHSYGEYVFDHGWANALERAGERYYPKLQVAVPFSPVPGPRLLRRPGTGVPVGVLANALEQACEADGVSSVHVTFCQEDEWHALGQAGWLRRMRHWDAFFRFYHATVDRKWGSAYLTRKFFSLLGQRLGDRVVLMYAEKDGKPVAGALNLAGSEALFGRNWGCVGEWPFLHFELCYYSAIDWAIAHGLKRVEAGAQGRHKIQRGYLPKPTYSAHYIAHPGLRRAVANFVAEERAGIEHDMKRLAEESPFRKDGET
jgi:predicted N-acyltransferase